jgi:glycerate 2-kinase
MRLRAVLERAFHEGLASVDLEERTRVAVTAMSRLGGAVHVVAIGKGGGAMLRGAARALGDRLRCALAIVPDGVDVAFRDSRVELLRAAHPIPDERSAAAGERALAFARGARRGTLLALVSGGASALACAPAPGVTLADKVRVSRELTSAGATIAELNVVRRHLSRIKGGGLVRVSIPAPVFTIVASDVIGSGAWTVGSGPSLVDPTSRADARVVLRRYGVSAPRLHETVGASVPGRRVGRARVIATPATLASEVARALERSHFEVSIRAPRTRDIAWFVREYAELARGLARGRAVVRAAEPTLVFDAGHAGRGGRCGHLAAALASSLPPGVTFLAAASDGVDGSSRAGGAIVDRRFVASVGEPRVERALRTFSTGPLHVRAGTAIRGGATGHNLCDVHILARERG